MPNPANPVGRIPGRFQPQNYHMTYIKAPESHEIDTQTKYVQDRPH